MKHTKQWFIKNIGKKLYRKPITRCGCKHCLETSFVIRDKLQAWYVHLCQEELGIEYFDTEEEMEKA